MSTETTTFKKDIVSKKKMASYSMGPFMEYFTISSFQLLIFYYYEVEIGLATVLVGLSMSLYAIWNMINDPLIGYLTDRPTRWSKKYGMRTPWIIIGAVLTIICFYFLFSAPTDIDAKSNPWPIFWYMVIITCLLDTAFSLFTTHFVGGFGNIFRTKEQRRMGSTITTFMAAISQVVCLVVLVPTIIVRGDPSSYNRFALVGCIFLAIALVIFLPGIYENETVRKRYLQIYEFLDTQKMPYFKFLKTAFKQKNYMVWLVAYTLFITAGALNYSNLLYFIIHVLKTDIQTLQIFGVAFLLSFLPSVFLWSRFVAKKTEPVNTCIIGTFLNTFFLLSFLWMTTTTQYFFMGILNGIAGGAFVCMVLNMISDTMDEVNVACGRHVEAGLVGIQNFFLRAAFLAVGIILAGVHIATGYVPGSVEQTELAIWGIRIIPGVFSASFNFIAFILLIKFYDLKGEKKEQMMAQLKKIGL
jgi:GPH family glycoside/pentoside/hexuronide:cation symporter